MDIDNRERNTDRMNLMLKLRIERAMNRSKKKKSRATSENDRRSVSVDLIYIHGPRVTSWLSILGSLEYRSHRWTSRGLIYWQTALPLTPRVQPHRPVQLRICPRKTPLSTFHRR